MLDEFNNYYEIDIDEESLKKRNKTDVLITLIYFSGCVFCVWNYFIYIDTLIYGWLLLLIWIIVGLACIPFSKKYILHFYKDTQFSHVFTFNLVGMSGIILFAFLYLNKNISFEENVRIINLTIWDSGYSLKGRSSRCAQSWARVKIGSHTKKFRYRCGLKIEDYSTVKVYLKKGIFGLDFIVCNKLGTS